MSDTATVQKSAACHVMAWVRQQDAARAAIRTKAPGRNDPCPCGSGRKYKRCCGKAT